MLVVNSKLHIAIQADPMHQGPAQMGLYKSTFDILHGLTHSRYHGCVLVHAINYDGLVQFRADKTNLVKIQ